MGISVLSDSIPIFHAWNILLASEANLPSCFNAGIFYIIIISLSLRTVVLSKYIVSLSIMSIHFKNVQISLLI